MSRSLVAKATAVVVTALVLALPATAAHADMIWG